MPAPATRCSTAGRATAATPISGPAAAAGGFASQPRWRAPEDRLVCSRGSVWEPELPVEFQIDHENRFVNVRAHGVVVLQEILDYFDALVVENAMAYPKLFDAREADPQLSNDEVMVLGARVSAYAAHDPRGPIAAVATDKKASEILQRFMN